MPIPDGGLITETNQQYYAGAQGFTVTAGAGQSVFTFTFNTDLILGSFNPAVAEYGLNNFKLYSSSDGITYTEYVSTYTLVDNVITLGAPLAQNNILVCQLKSLTGGEYGNRDAYGVAVEENYGSYAYVTLHDVINNFIVGYVGKDKLIPDVRRSDIIFHAKRGLQEFSYDTLKSVKSQELTIPPSLSVILPQDYVNYVRISRIDTLGVQRIIYPANNLTNSPYEMPVQDSIGTPTQDWNADNLEGSSITEERWDKANTNLISQDYNMALFNDGFAWAGYNWGNGNYWNWGEQYGMSPQYAQYNGWFNMNDREGKVSFSSNLANQIIILEYISDGLAYDLDSRIPKMAEDALYSYISHAIIASRINQPEYVVQRLKREKSAKLRNAKIRLSNIKLDEIVQVMRGQSKWIKR